MRTSIGLAPSHSAASGRTTAPTRLSWLLYSGAGMAIGRCVRRGRARSASQTPYTAAYEQDQRAKPRGRARTPRVLGLVLTLPGLEPLERSHQGGNAYRVRLVCWADPLRGTGSSVDLIVQINARQSVGWTNID